MIQPILPSKKYNDKILANGSMAAIPVKEPKTLTSIDVRKPDMDCQSDNG